MFSKATQRYFKTLKNGKVEFEFEVTDQSTLTDLKVDFKKLCRGKLCESINEYASILEQKGHHKKVIEVLDNLPDFERIIDFMNEFPLNIKRTAQNTKGLIQRVCKKRSNKT